MEVEDTIISPSEYQDLYEFLVKLGFENAVDILKTIKVEPSRYKSGEQRRLYYDPTPNQDGIVFEFVSEYAFIDKKIGIDTIISKMAYQPQDPSKPSKTLQRQYHHFAGLETKSQIIEAFHNEAGELRRKEDLSKDIALRKEFSKLGFDYDKLVESSFLMYKRNPNNKGWTMFHEELPLVGTTSSYPKRVWLMLIVKELPDKKRQIEYVETSVSKGKIVDGSTNPEINYYRIDAPIPTKLQMIENLSKEYPLQFPAKIKARQIDRLIQDAKNKKPKNFLSHFIRNK